MDRLKALEQYLVEQFGNSGKVHHSELKSICERGYRYSYATGVIICKRNKIKII